MTALYANVCPQIKHINKASHIPLVVVEGGGEEQPCEDHLLTILQGAMPHGPVGSSRPKFNSQALSMRFQEGLRYKPY